MLASAAVGRRTLPGWRDQGRDQPPASLAGGNNARYRQALRRLEKDGATFRIVPREGVPAMMTQLRLVSDDWLSAKASAEKGFSLGFFDDAYLARFHRLDALRS